METACSNATIFIAAGGVTDEDRKNSTCPASLSLSFLLNVFEPGQTQQVFRIFDKRSHFLTDHSILKKKATARILEG